MIVNGTVDIVISEAEQRRIAIAYLRKRFKFSDADTFVQDGKVYTAEYHPRGSRLKDEFVRNASEEDVTIYNALLII
jgi:hypothetical protein